MRYPDPFAPSEKWQPYERPPDESFQPLDTQAVDLNTFLRGEEAQKFLGQSPRPKEAVQGTVMLPDGTPAQLTQRVDGSWELAVHLKRDFFQVFTASTRDEVIRLAIGDGNVRRA